MYIIAIWFCMSLEFRCAVKQCMWYNEFNLLFFFSLYYGFICDVTVNIYNILGYTVSQKRDTCVRTIDLTISSVNVD